MIKVGPAVGVLAAAIWFFSPALSRAQERVGPSLSLPEALRLTLERNPSVKSFSAKERAAVARRADAGKLPNPDLSFTTENMRISDRRETSITLSQPLDLGGERRARRDLAQALALQASHELSAEERAVLSATAARFFDAWALQERVALMNKGLALADEAIAAATARFRAGAAPEAERVRAEVQKALRAAEARKAAVELDIAKRVLALQWRGDPAVGSVSLGSPEEGPVPSVDSLLAHIVSHPEQLTAAAAVAVEEARLREARAARVPAVALEGGFKRLQEVGATGFSAGVSLSVPLWNQSRGAVHAAAAERDAAVARQEAVRTSLMAAVENARGRLLAALHSMAALRQEVAPRAQEALSLIQSGYRAGRFSYLDLAEAQRALLEAELAGADASVEAWRARLELESIAGGALFQTGEGGMK
jgi:cobalt-zinc-cadmium efflux system outer membrane protein